MAGFFPPNLLIQHIGVANTGFEKFSYENNQWDRESPIVAANSAKVTTGSRRWSR
jgi:hypothetical protein